MFAKLMAHRSDRRPASLSNSLALEAVEPIRTRRADFHQGPERRTALLIEAGYTIATGSAFTPANTLARGAGSIYESSNPFRFHPVLNVVDSPERSAKLLPVPPAAYFS